MLLSFTYANRVNTLVDAGLKERRALVSSRSLGESAAAEMVVEQYLQERDPELPPTGPSCIADHRGRACVRQSRGGVQSDGSASRAAELGRALRLAPWVSRSFLLGPNLMALRAKLALGHLAGPTNDSRA